MSKKMLRLTDEQLTVHQSWKDREAAREAANEPPRPKLKLTMPRPLETDIQSDVLKALLVHPKVGWAVRLNSGAGKFVYPDGSTSRFLRFGFPGMSDLWAQLKDGRLCCVEVKRIDEEPTADQQAFLDRVNRHGGVAFVARGVDDVLREMGAA